MEALFSTLVGSSNFSIAFFLLTLRIKMTVTERLYVEGTLARTMREVRPTAFLGVPSVWETMQERITSTINTQPLYRRLLIQWARAVGLRGNMSLMNGFSLFD